MFCMYTEEDNLAMSVSYAARDLLYLQWQSLTVGPENLETEMSAIRYLHERFVGFE
jgi:hypothetical protein